MPTRITCIVPLLDQRSPRRITPLRDPQSVVTAQALDWPGMLLETGRNDVAEVDDLTLAHHYLGLNADDRPITLGIKEQNGFRPVMLPPGAGWFSPAAESFSLRLQAARPHAYLRITIDPIRFDRLVSTSEDTARPTALHRALDIRAPQLQRVAVALANEASAGTPSGLAFVDTMTAALGLQLLQKAGVRPPPPARYHGGLAPGARRRVLELMDAHPEARLTIDALAREAGLSPTHFSRAFKESTGRAPHQHLMALRLDRARRLLEGPDAMLSDIAQRTGFADQAHFTRFFKRRFGVTPGALLRERRR